MAKKVSGGWSKQVQDLEQEQARLQSRIVELEGQQDDHDLPASEVGGVVSGLAEARRALQAVSVRLDYARSALREEQAGQNQQELVKARKVEQEAERDVMDAVDALWSGPLARLYDAQRGVVDLGGYPHNDCFFIDQGVRRQRARWKFAESMRQGQG